MLFASGMVISLVVGIATMLLGYRILKVPLNHLIGVYAGGQTQPIVLGFAKDRAGNDLPVNRLRSRLPYRDGCENHSQ